MPENPYEPPQAPRDLSRTFPWGPICLVALTLALASLAVLISQAKFRDGGVTFLSGGLALSLSGLFCVGSLAFIAGATGWFFAALRRRRAAKPLRT